MEERQKERDQEKAKEIKTVIERDGRKNGGNDVNLFEFHFIILRWKWAHFLIL